MEIDVTQLPIPDWGLECPRCRYPLRGLPEPRCPECGLQINVPSMIRSWTPLRPPRFTGRELPQPDFGLRCRSCGAPLAGATEYACAHCRRPFDPASFIPERAWFRLTEEICGGPLLASAYALLGDDHIPHMPDNERTLVEIYGGIQQPIPRLRIPREYFFDTCWLFRKHVREQEAERLRPQRADWRCAGCGEDNPGNFELCWNCERARPAE